MSAITMVKSSLTNAVVVQDVLELDHRILMSSVLSLF